MSGSLARVLRLRALFENVSRVEAERRARSLARVEDAMERERMLAEESRRGWFESLSGRQEERARAGSDAAQTGEDRALAGADGALALAKRERLQPLRAREAQQLNRARDLWRLRHRERRQVEVVIEARARETKTEEERRVQRGLDDWFQLRRAQSAAREKAERKSPEGPDESVSERFLSQH